MTIKTLSRMPYAQARVRQEEGVYALVSYKTVVAILDAITGWLTITGLYSPTTKRHIGAFMQEYCGGTYQQAKELYNNGLRYNIYTGEVQDVR